MTTTTRTITEIQADIDAIEAERSADTRPAWRLDQPVSAERQAWDARSGHRMIRLFALLAELNAASNIDGEW